MKIKNDVKKCFNIIRKIKLKELKQQSKII